MAHPENLKDRSLTAIHSDLFTCEDFPKPYILVEPETQIALRGKDLTLFCRAASTSPAPMNFVWKKDGSVLEYAECDNDNSCIMNIAHSFDGKGMEITSELRLKNLTHVDIGSYQCIVDNIYGATYSTKSDISTHSLSSPRGTKPFRVALALLSNVLQQVNIYSFSSFCCREGGGGVSFTRGLSFMRGSFKLKSLILFNEHMKIHNELNNCIIF